MTWEASVAVKLGTLDLNVAVSGSTDPLAIVGERGAGVLPSADLIVRIQHQEQGRRVDMLPGSGEGERVIDRLGRVSAAKLPR